MSWFSWLAGSGDPNTTLQSSGQLSREVFIEFATKCTATFASPEFISELKDAVKVKKENADDHIEKMQFQLFQSLGIQGHFGMSELRQVQRRFGQDADVMQAFMQLVSAEEQLLDTVELSPEALSAKQAVSEQVQQFQSQMWQLSRKVPDEKQAELMEAVAESMKEAAKQVPTSEGATPAEAQAAAREQIRIACDTLSRRGFAVPDALSNPAVPASRGGGEMPEAPASASIASSAMTAAEQARFLSTMASAPDGDRRRHG